MMTYWIAAAIAMTTLVVAAGAPARAQDAGEVAFAKQCARCHSVAKAVEFMKAHPDAKERAAWLEHKLTRHHARDAVERASIVAFLESAYGAAEKKK